MHLKYEEIIEYIFVFSGAVFGNRLVDG